MKKVFFLLFFVCLGFSVKAEEFKAFRVDLGLGYAAPAKGGGGVTFAMEPKYAVIPKLDVGIRAEFALMARIYQDLNGVEHEAELKANSSYLLTGDYHFMQKKFRPFAGAGLGVYAINGVSADSNLDISTNKENKFGFMLRAGFDVAHIRLAAEYNILGKDAYDNSANYLGVKLSFYIGGGIKK